MAVHNILPFCLEGKFGEQQRRTLFNLMSCLADVFAESHDTFTLDELEAKVAMALALLERDWPVDIQVRTVVE